GYLGDNMDEYKVNFSKEFTDVQKLDISNSVGKLTVKSGDRFMVEGRNVSKNFKATVKNGTLIVEDENVVKFLFFTISRPNTKLSITVYVPFDFTAKEIKINSGAGEVIMEDLSTERLIIDAGVGTIFGRNITAQSVKGNGGVGDITFNDVNFSNVDFDSGVGNLKIDGILLGDSEFDFGVGDIRLNINGSREDYALRIDNGIGSIRVNGEKISSDYKDIGKATHTIKIDGGVGSVEIDFDF
ncbi:MAG TPA: DUF4097 family beta strand repeat-containing protein, partial [Mobilitalea sp.]|nr:DUF4097 family beta strand repeat-containing protein [Mobilitalea sp.]